MMDKSRKCLILIALGLSACDPDAGSIAGPVVLRVTGVVANAASQPLAGVEVSLRALDRGCRVPITSDSVLATTDSSGKYTARIGFGKASQGGCARVTAWPPAGERWDPISATSGPEPVGAADSARVDVRVSESRVFFEWLATPSVGLSADALRIRYDDGSGPRLVSGRDFTTEDYAVPHTQVMATRTSGNLAVDAAVVAGDTINAGSLSLPLRAGWIWRLGVRITHGDPLAACFGCVQAKALPMLRPVPGAPEDSVYLVWGGDTYPVGGIVR